jgi:hypothetical protein
MEKAHGVGQDVEAMRVCNLLLAGAQVPADSEDATKFRATFPRPMSQALSMEEYEAQVEQAFEDIASSTRLAIYIANAVLRERVYLDARDLNMDFTNRALTMGIVAIATAAQGVETLNSDSIDDPLSRTRAMELLCEASDVVNECLEGQDGVQRWISAVARDGAGITMRKNLKIVREMILSIQQVARDYFRQNPLD